MTEGFGSGEVDRDEYFDSRTVIDVILRWANQFNEIWAWSDWTEFEYMDEIRNFFDLKVLERKMESRGRTLRGSDSL